MRKQALLAFIFLGILPAGFAFAQTASSPNFQNSDPSVLPLIVNTQSGNFSIDGSVDPIVGTAQSGSFTVEGGTQEDPGTVPNTPQPGAGGSVANGGQVLFQAENPLQAPTIAPIVWTYRSTVMVTGTRGSSDVPIFFNGSENGVRYPNSREWARSLPLGLGNNAIFVQAKAVNRVSIVVEGVARRRLIGDVNDNQVVDDVDLSLLSRHWKKYDRQSDFNHDEEINDYDLSLLAGHWGMSF